MAASHSTLTPQDLAIMKVVWGMGDATVRDVHDALQARRPLAYTTVMTMMRILEEKGFLKKNAGERAHIYRPAKPRHQVLGAMVRDFVDRVFDGASEPLLLHLAKDNKLTPKQKKIVAQLLKDVEDAE